MNLEQRRFLQTLSKYSIPILLIIIFISLQFCDSKETKFITKSGYMGSHSKSSMERLIECSINKDYNCIDNLKYSGEIFELPSNTEVKIIKSEIKGSVNIKIIGETQTIWTFREALNKN